MKAKGRFVSFLLVANAFFGGYAVGLNSRQVDVVDASLPKYEPPKSAASSTPTGGAKATEGDKSGSAAADKDTGKPKAKVDSPAAKEAGNGGDASRKPDSKKHHHGKAHHSKGH